MAFLPIHAAGVYQVASSQSISDYVASSYIPTLSSLTKARSSWKSIERAQVAGLIICEDASELNTTRHLPQAVVEVEAVRECFVASEAQILNAHSVHTSPSELRSILEGTPTHILHLACHATQEPDPLRSAFLLKDGALTIQDIIQMNLPHAMLAYLSACQTAKGDRNAPDEAVHLAASMLFCGFRSVVGTMWSVHCSSYGRELAR
jgi:CHAT domain-containing protein